MLLPCGHDFHLRHVPLVVELPETDQQISILCIVGKHALQCRYIDVRIAHSSRSRLSSMPIPGILDSDVRMSICCLEEAKANDFKACACRCTVEPCYGHQRLPHVVQEI